MSTIKAVDKLRKNLREWVGTDRWETLGTQAEFDALADEIEAEVEEMKAFCERVEKAAKAREELEAFGVAYMPYPLDADGMPIREGDKMKDVSEFGHEWDVLAVARGYWVSVDGSKHKPGQYVHSRRTLEDVLMDYGRDYRDVMSLFDSGEATGPSPHELIDKYADEIRELMGVEE